MVRSLNVLSILLLCTISLVACFPRVAEVLTNHDPLNPIQPDVSESVGPVNNREQRSPQFGLLSDYDDNYSDYDEVPRHLGRKHKHPHKPVIQISHGCRGYSCGGGYPDHGGYHQPSGHGGYYQPSGHGGYHQPSGHGTFATAAAGSLSSGPHGGGGHSGANAQSASFSFGPYSATFSAAQASSGH